MTNVFEKLNTKEIVELIDKITDSIDREIDKKFAEKNIWEKEKYKIINEVNKNE